MTIPTKVNEEKPKEAQVLINPETVVKVEFKQAVRDAAEKQQRRVHAAVNKLIQYRRRRYMAVSIAVAVASFLVVVAGICGGIYVYKWIFNSRRMSTQGYMPQGGCVVPYHDDARIEGYAQAQVQERGELSRVLQSSTRRPRNRVVQPYGARGSFEERYNVLNSDQEMLQVPQPGVGSFDAAPMTIIHDFTVKLTAIVDTWNERCYVKPLDPSVVPPRDLLDLMRRISDGSYVPNVCLIRKHYRPEAMPLDMEGLSGLGSSMVFASCAHYTTYRLVPINAPTLTSTLPPATTPTILSELIEAEDEDEEDVPEEDMPDSETEELEVPQEDDLIHTDDVEVDVERTKRSADKQIAPMASADSQVPEEDAQSNLSDVVPTQEITDASDLVFNVGFAGSETVELAVVHLD